MSMLKIPLRNVDEEVEFYTENWPQSKELIDFLEFEGCSLKFWIKVAMVFYNKNKFEDFVLVLEKSLTVHENDAELEDKLSVYDLLTAYYIEVAHRETNQEMKNEFLMKAKRFLTFGDNILMYDGNHMAIRAFFLLANGENIKRAEEQFNFIVLQKSGNLAAQIGKGFIYFLRKDYHEALLSFKKILQEDPQCPPKMRVAIGYTALKLSNHDLAKAAFERALSLQPDCFEALVGLSIMYINMHYSNTTKSAIEMLARVYGHNTKNPIVLNHLSTHFFFKKDFDKALQLAMHAYNFSDNEAMRAEISYNIGRCYHIQKQFDQAFQYYFQSAQCASKNYTLPHYRLGQLYMYRLHFKKAIECFERVHSVLPEDLDTLKMLGILYSKSGKSENLNLAKEYLKKVTQEKPNDIEAWTELARILEKSNFQESFDAYKSICSIYVHHLNTQIPIEYVNNMAALCYRMADYERSEVLLTRSLGFLEERQNEIPAKKYVALRIMLQYNLARVYEFLCSDNSASELYKQILRSYPVYTDCLLRLGCIERDKGQIFLASNYFNKALMIDNKNIDARILLGNLYFSKMRFEEATHQFEKIVDVSRAHKESYALIALGNMHLSTLHRPNRKKSNNKLIAEIALSFYNKVLRFEEKNIYAANGVGATLAHLGHFNEARDIFSQVRESTADFCDVWMNIAHIYVENRQYGNAIQMYLNCIKRFFAHHNVKLMQYLARAYFCADKFAEARLIILKARHVAPNNSALLYFLGIILQRLSLNTLKNERASLNEVREAVYQITLAKSYFEHLSKNTGNSEFRSESVENEVRFCEDIMQQSRSILQRAKLLDNELRNQRRNQEASRLAFLQMQEATRKQQEEIEVERKAFKQKIHQECVEKAKYFRQTMVGTQEKRRNKKLNKSTVEFVETQDGAISTESDDDAGTQQDNEKHQKAKKKSGAKATTKKTKSITSKRKLQKKTKTSKGHFSRSSSDEDTSAENRGTRIKKHAEGLRIVSKEFISSSESEGSDAVIEVMSDENPDSNTN